MGKLGTQSMLLHGEKWFDSKGHLIRRTHHFRFTNSPQTKSNTSFSSSMEEDQCNPFFWKPCFQEEVMMDEFKQALFYATLELESTVSTAKMEIARRDSELVQLEDHLSRVIGERDEALLRSQRLQIENLILRQQLDRNRTQTQDSPTSQCPNSISHDGGNGEKVAITGREQLRARSPSPQRAVDLDELVADRQLPEIGKLLQAVMDTGPILQTLMLAGRLPQWQHPPPQLDSAQIPPVDIPNKRALESNSNEGSSESPRNKCIKLIS